MPCPVVFRSMKIGSFRMDEESPSNTINSSMSVSEPLNRVFAFAQEVRGPLTALLYFLTDDSDSHTFNTPATP